MTMIAQHIRFFHSIQHSDIWGLICGMDE